MKAQIRWTEKQFAREAQKSAALFREARLQPTEQWKAHVERQGSSSRNCSACSAISLRAA